MGEELANTHSLSPSSSTSFASFILPIAQCNQLSSPASYLKLGHTSSSSLAQPPPPHTHTHPTSSGISIWLTWRYLTEQAHETAAKDSAHSSSHANSSLQSLQRLSFEGRPTLLYPIPSPSFSCCVTFVLRFVTINAEDATPSKGRNH